MDASTASATISTPGLGDHRNASAIAPLPTTPRRPQPHADQPSAALLHPMLQSPVLEMITELLRRHDHPEADSVDLVRTNYLSAYNSPTVEAIVARLCQYLPDADADLVRRAYALALIAHSGQFRQSGEPYIDHPVAVATILLDLRLDAESIAAALLHDVVEDTGITLELLRQFFGETITHLVDGVTKLSGLEYKTKEEIQAGSYRKMFIATADDPRVILIKLSDRLHNMRTLGVTSPDKQRRVSRETFDIYAPLAHRLGMWQVKSELEDLAFKGMYPDRYKEISAGLSMRKESRERLIQRVINKLHEALEKEGLRAHVSGRPKHIYSIWRKMERKGVPLEQIYDQLAVRVIVQETDPDKAKGSCYRVLGLVHSTWTPVLSEFDDYIAVPKESSYQSLHTTVIIPGGHHCEVQIRSEDMHTVAEHGIAAHWRYKEGFASRSDQNYETKIRWLRELISWRIELADDREFVESLRPELEEMVYVFTPKGKIIDLPLGSTPIDFAYHIHSEVGHRCIGARVNGRMVPLDYQLKNGEIVDIMTAKVGRGPSRDWLNFVKTPSARNHIKRHFRRAERDENVSAGRDLLEKELKRLGLTVSFDHLVDLINARSIEEMFHQIGIGELTARGVAQKALAQQVEQQQPASDSLPLELLKATAPQRSQPVGVQVAGVGTIYNRLARCCNPVLGEPIVGFVTRGRGVTVHRADCRTIVNERDRNRLIDVTWGGQQPKGYAVPVRIESWDRVGLWRDISAAVADAGINIERVDQGQTRRAGRAVLHIVLTIQSINQLSSILDRLNRINDVIEARRESTTKG
ncbi:MAG: bifunctional (p)ppGpp synthetase/guanosine-3',5'-bis(diphosphate) 3'-pyrophosphohydrolase [Candidatus Viridilinea halotolerans]|uniref:Bifunctional (P)ppGpp synthetase/guanosine-3',5'-bis(Diphosphate) 3'-pyrophosphohydrolase n=1 Tax=Candidatus Viridilinea halotolerans TaxID=2491704 RepID=A0A426TWE9_9CHLR|nr:MAG: bifunctional (p)ppGpp synthetase/guanosine-3',5'-bis(diphosphate) 3'-pyrophosphohydrolase [Candidatus Viridilinea halotolerans]